jgi:serine/threonine protein kinase
MTSPSPAGDDTLPHVSGTWANLQVVEPIGRGGFGRVYRAHDPALARDVALKIVDLPSRDPAWVAEVLREGRLLARVRHPNVVTVYGAQEYEGLVGIWMELVRGRSLAAIVREDGPMGPEEATVLEDC